MVMCKRMPSRSGGFTLVEMIVTIGVIALLIGLALPALSGAGSAGRSALSQSNLRQMAIAAHSYANLHHRYPPAVQYAVVDGMMHSRAWDWETTFDGELIGPGPLWEFTDHPGRVMECPAYHGSANSPGDPHTGYNYSVYVGGEQVFNQNLTFYPGVNPNAVRRPSTCAMFGLGGYSSGANKFMRSPLHQSTDVLPALGLPEVYSGAQAFRYRGRTLVAHVDGHVATKSEPYKGVNHTPDLLGQMGYPRNGFLSDDHSAYAPQ